MTPEEVDEAIRSGDRERVLALMEGATEAERRAAAPVAVEWHKRVHEHWRASFGGRGKQMPDRLYEAVRSTAPLAIAGCAGASEVLKLPLEHDAFFRILSARKPAWLQSFADQAIARSYWYWPLIRSLERAGLIARPSSDRYPIGMVVAGYRTDPYRLLTEDAELLDEQVWRLFEVEGDRDASLASNDQYSGIRSWSETLIRLSQEGRLSRDRLLDASLDALARDFAQYRAGWFSRFHEALQPTLEERAARIDRYLRLLASPIPPTVSFALKALTALDRAGRLSPEALLEHGAPALAAREKGTVTAILKLLGRAAKANPALAARAAELATEALIHENPEVQGAALDLIEKHGTPIAAGLRRLLEDRREDVAASQRARLEALLGSAPDTSEGAVGSVGEEFDLSQLVARAGAIPARWRQLAGVDAVLEAAVAGRLHAPALPLPALEIPRLVPGTEIESIRDLDELIDSFTTLLENFDPPEEIERALDGLSRLCAERPDDFARRIGPLRKRAQKLFIDDSWMMTWWGRQQQDVSVLILAWTTGEMPKYQAPKQGREIDLAHFTGQRLLELARRVTAGRARPLLALPTHQGGWIDPRMLVERVAAAGGWDLCDAVQALLRLAPDHRPEARAEAAALPGELGAALRYALGGEAEIGKSAALWVAAARARAPMEDDPAVEARHPQLGPDAGLAPRLTFAVKHKTSTYSGKVYHYYTPQLGAKPEVPRKPRVDLPTVLHHPHTPGERVEWARWSALIWPLGRRAWFAAGVRTIGANLDWWEANWTERFLLEPLLEPDTAIGDMGALLLALGLGAKETTLSALSIDALIAAIADGRIDASTLGGELCRLAPTGLVKPARWAKTLGEAARVSALHREVIRDALVALIGARAEMRPADLVAILTLLQELCVECGAAVTDEGARAALAELKSGKSGGLAKSILALHEADQDAHQRRAAAAALAGRIERAERWVNSFTRM